MWCRRDIQGSSPMSWHLHVLNSFACAKLFLHNVSRTIFFLGTTTFEDGRKLHNREREKKLRKSAVCWGGNKLCWCARLENLNSFVREHSCLPSALEVLPLFWSLWLFHNVRHTFTELFFMRYVGELEEQRLIFFFRKSLQLLKNIQFLLAALHYLKKQRHSLWGLCTRIRMSWS